MSDVTANLWRGPTLVLDAATATVHAGILRDGEWTALVEREGEALETIFSATAQALADASLTLHDIQHVALGVGPGSILGLRLALMAVNTWRRLPEHAHWRCHQFLGLRLHGQLLAATGRWTQGSLYSDFRREAWHRIPLVEGSASAPSIVTADELQACDGPRLYTPTGRGTTSLPEPYEAVPFSLSELPALAPQAWADPVDEPELYLPAPPVFKKWSAQRHR